MQYCPAKASKILQNVWHCPAYTNTRVGKYDINYIKHSNYIVTLYQLPE